MLTMCEQLKQIFCYLLVFIADIWFYHRVLWKDADGDGLLDIFTCRARQENFPSDTQI